MEGPRNPAVLLEPGATRRQAPPIQSLPARPMSQLQSNRTRAAMSSPGSPRAEDLPRTRRKRAARTPRPVDHRAPLERASAADLWGSLMSERGSVNLEALGALRDLLQARYFDAARSQVLRRSTD